MKYRHSPYFAAKKAAERAAAAAAGQMLPGAFASVERRVAQLGTVELNRFADTALIHVGRGDVFKEEYTRLRYDWCTPHVMVLMGLAIAYDIGVSMVRDVKTLADPAARAVIKRELMRDLRMLRRPWYYANETKRRRKLALERRKIKRRRTTAPCPTPADLMAAWSARKESKAAMVRLGGMLQDLACYVDSGLRYDDYGNIVGRNGGIRGWLREKMPDLSEHYKTLMRYKAMAVNLRQATGLEDPTPTSALLDLVGDGNCECGASGNGCEDCGDGDSGGGDRDGDAGSVGREAKRQKRSHLTQKPQVSGVGMKNENYMRKNLALGDTEEITRGKMRGNVKEIRQLREIAREILAGCGKNTFADLARAIEMKIGVDRVGYE